MQEIKVVLGTDDGVKLSPGHLGDSSFFLVYSLGPEGATLLRKIKNPVAEAEEHAGEGKMKKVLEALGDVDVLAARKSSPNFKKIASSTPIQPVRLKAETVEEALQVLQSNYSLLSELLARRRKGERDPQIPLLS